MTEEEKVENLLKTIAETKNFALKDSMERYIAALLDVRKFLLHDLVSFSIAIVGIVIPILLSSSLANTINKPLLFFSFSVFILHIVIGISARFIISKRELASWPKTREEVDKKMENNMRDVADSFRNNTKNYDEILSDLIDKNKTKQNDNEGISTIDKFLNLDNWLFGLFILAFTALSYSILKILI